MNYLKPHPKKSAFRLITNSRKKNGLIVTTGKQPRKKYIYKNGVRILGEVPSEVPEEPNFIFRASFIPRRCGQQGIGWSRHGSQYFFMIDKDTNEEYHFSVNSIYLLLESIVSGHHRSENGTISGIWTFSKIGSVVVVSPYMDEILEREIFSFRNKEKTIRRFDV